MTTRDTLEAARTTLDIDDRGVALLRLSDESGKNALSEAMVGELLARFDELGREPTLKVIVLAGLPEMFCSGASVGVLKGFLEGRHQPRDLLLPRAIFDLPVPVLAAMEGSALGGGLALGVCADVVLVARESRYGATFMNLGFTPGMGMTRLLEHVMVPALAHEMLLSGEALRGAHFAGRGFNHVLPRAEVLPKALDLSARIAEKPRRALELLKRSLTAPRRQAFEASRTEEALMHELTFQSDEARRLVEDSDDQ